MSNPRLFVAILVVFGLYALITLGVHLPNAGPAWLVSTRIPDGYWGQFHPLAQFTGGACLAYLALEMFRHSRIASDFVSTFFAPSKEDSRSITNVLQNINLATENDHDQLVVLIRVFELGAARDAWVQQKPDAHIGGHSYPPPKALVVSRDNARKSPWFGKGPGKRFLGTFFTGADAIIVSSSLGVALWIHLMATVEHFQKLTLPRFLLDPLVLQLGTSQVDIAWWPWLQTLGMLIFGALYPLYYVSAGRGVIDDLKGIADRGSEQLALLLRKIDESDQRAAQELEALVQGPQSRR